MDIFYLIGTILFAFLCIIIVLLVRLSKIKKDRDKYKNININKIEEIFKERWNKEEQDFKLKKTELQIEEKEINSALAQLKTSLKEKEKRYEEVNQDLNLYKKGKIKEIDGAAAEYEQRKQLEIKQNLQQRELQANSDFNNHVDSYIIQKAQMQSEIKEIKAELEIERSKRAAINEEILRAKQIEEQQDFYRIQLNEEDKKDIEILKSITPRLRHPEAINKVIWTGYYQKPLAELRKRAGIEGSGVYKITRLKTGEVYIGQAVNISTRWAEHCKSALGVGTLASSQLHRVMAEDGAENFTFEVVEEVEKDKLKERESFYIDFYDSKNYGLNSVSGVKNK